jgi:hypothetical protein
VGKWGKRLGPGAWSLERWTLSVERGRAKKPGKKRPGEMRGRGKDKRPGQARPRPPQAHQQAHQQARPQATHKLPTKPPRPLLSSLYQNAGLPRDVRPHARHAFTTRTHPTQHDTTRQHNTTQPTLNRPCRTHARACGMEASPKPCPAPRRLNSKTVGERAKGLGGVSK